tara:strand:+ start:33201 stop:33473 length:273 start_codon:yes stop_codon:yes gene_type:complete
MAANPMGATTYSKPRAVLANMYLSHIAATVYGNWRPLPTARNVHFGRNCRFAPALELTRRRVTPPLTSKWGGNHGQFIHDGPPEIRTGVR